MNKAKKLASLLLALVMALALAAPAFAQETGGKFEDNDGVVTITNASAGTEYKLYRIFDLESFDTNPTAYSYRVNDQWKGFLNSTIGEGDAAKSVINNYVTVETVTVPQDDGKDETVQYVSWVEGASAREFADAAIKYAKDNSITADKTGTPEADGEYSFTGLPLGYYLVSSSDTDALCSLDTTNKVAEVKEKKTEPTVDKKVQEMPSGAWQSTNDTGIGATVNFQTTVTTGQNLAEDKPYILHDAMGDGLDFVAVNSIVVDGKEIPATTEDGTVNYTINTTPAAHAKDETAISEWACDFEITFSYDFLKTLNPGTDIVVNYSATLNENAVIADVGNPNKTLIEYNDKNFTAESTTRTYTYEFDLIKTDSKNILLDGAVFTLYTVGADVDEDGHLIRNKDSNAVHFRTVLEQGSDGWNVYFVDESKDENGNYKGTTDIVVEKGKIVIRGLDAGTYYLHEETAPNGYNRLDADVVVEVKQEVVDAATGEVIDKVVVNGKETAAGTTIEKDAAGNWIYNTTVGGGVQVVNNTGAQLPSTGGIGTTIFYIVGGVLAAGAVILLITKRRMNIDK